MLQIRRVVRAVDVLVLQAIELIFVEGFVPRTLNQPATRRVVVRRRQREPGAAADPVDRLHERLAERRLADDVGAIVILEGAGDDFRRARTVTVRQRDDRDTGELAVLGRTIFLVRVRDAAVRGDDHLAARQELVGDLDRLVERAARIAADVEQQPLHALRREIGERVLHVAIGVLAEVLHPDVAGRRVDHEVRRHRRDVDLVARELELDHLAVAAPLHADVDLRALGTAQLAHRLLGRPALHVLAFDVREDVAAANALLVRRRTLEDVHRRDVAVLRDDRHADAVVAAFLAFAHLRVLFRAEEARMRIERPEHAAHGAVDEVVGIDLVDVVGFDGAERGREGAVVLGAFVVGGEGAPSEEAADQRGYGNREDNSGQRTVASHDWHRSR